MIVIGRTKPADFCEKERGQAESLLKAWLEEAETGQWKTSNDIISPTEARTPKTLIQEVAQIMGAGKEATLAAKDPSKFADTLQTAFEGSVCE